MRIPAVVTDSNAVDVHGVVVYRECHGIKLLYVDCSVKQLQPVGSGVTQDGVPEVYLVVPGCGRDTVTLSFPSLVGWGVFSAVVDGHVMSITLALDNDS